MSGAAAAPIEDSTRTIRLVKLEPGEALMTALAALAA